MDFKILVAEDSYPDQSMYRFAFGGNALVVDNLQSAVRVATGRKYDIYITDESYPLSLGQPEEAGICFKFYDEIKKLDPSAKVILASKFDMGLSAVKERYPDMTYMTKIAVCKNLEKIIAEIRAKRTSLKA